jgi:basic membrane protein A
VLSRSAEAIFAGLTEEAQAVAVQVFLHLVQVGAGASEARRRLPVADLMSLDLEPVALSAVLDAFGERRLLTFDRDPATQQATAEVAHESLFREWDRLAGWIDRHRAGLQRYQALVAATDEWQAAGRHPDYLLTGTRLEEFESWIEDAVVHVSDRQREFIVAGLQRRRSEEEAERTRVEAERRLERRARIRLGALAAVVLLTVGAAGLAAWTGWFDGPAHVALLHTGFGEVDTINEAGFDRAVSELGLVGAEAFFNPNALEGDEELRAMAAGDADLVLVTGRTPSAEVIASDHPDTLFVFGSPVAGEGNVAYLQFADNQSAYLAGVAAALATRTGTIGFVGGMDSVDIWAFHAGFQAGARSVDPEVVILFEYLAQSGDFSGFNDAAGAREAARQMYRAGGDVVFHAAGGAGVGVFEAAVEESTDARHLWAIGVDSDQYWSVLALPGAVDPGSWREHILTSVIKRVDVATHDVITDFANGEWVAGKRAYDLASRAVDISYSGGFVSEYRRQIDAARQLIIDRAVIVPCFPTERVDAARSLEFRLTDDHCWR